MRHMHTRNKVYIQTWGCQMNVYDSTRMEDALEPLGYARTESAEEADIIILNTCHIREKAAEKVYSELGRLRELKEQKAARGESVLLAVGGCVAQAEGEEILRRAPQVDFIMGSQGYHALPRLVRGALAGVRGGKELEFPLTPKFDLLPESTRPQGVSAFLAVQEGCDKFCTFCVVPYTRGAEYSRPAADVLREARAMVEMKGVREITLLGQNVNAYHGEDASGRSVSLAALMERLAEIPGLERIRYTTSHPRDMRDDLMEAHRDNPKLMPYLHLPVQSGSDRVLKAMNRGHTAAEYLAIIEKLRGIRPDMAFSGDFIVGFPGEEEADFQDTLRLVETVGYASAYSFAYSPRPGTPAAKRGRQVEAEEQSRRLAELQALLTRQQRRFNEGFVGREVDVLFDRPGKRAGQMIGRSPWMHSVHLDDAAAEYGRIVRVRIASASASSLKGERMARAEAAA
jgi:tRNA-2-methylthio-N6-dimethylallyladenosine synthase